MDEVVDKVENGFALVFFEIKKFRLIKLMSIRRKIIMRTLSHKFYIIYKICKKLKLLMFFRLECIFLLKLRGSIEVFNIT